MLPRRQLERLVWFSLGTFSSLIYSNVKDLLQPLKGFTCYPPIPIPQPFGYDNATLQDIQRPPIAGLSTPSTFADHGPQWNISRSAAYLDHVSLDLGRLFESAKFSGVLASLAAYELPSTSLWLYTSLILACLIIVRLYQLTRTYSAFRVFVRRNRCLPVRIMPNPFPWKLRRYWTISKMDPGLMDEYLLRKFQENGLTHGMATKFTGSLKAISTIEPRNFQAILATKFDDWERPWFRAAAVSPLIGPGIFTTDGPHWAYARKLVKAHFTRRQIEDNLAVSERHFQLMMTAIGKVDYSGWTGEIDLMQFFFRFSVDTSSEFLFGMSANTQTSAMVHKGTLAPSKATSLMDGFEVAFKRVAWYIGVRTKLGKSFWLCDGLGYRRASYDIINIHDSFITKAIERAETQLAANNGEATNVLEAMVAEGHDFGWISNQCRHLIIAGFETTTATLSFIFALLERHPRVFNHLREVILSHFGTEANPRQPLTFETLKNCKYLQYVINETMRLYPAGPVNLRVAVRDTVLPTGGGPDGTAPVAVPKGSTVHLGVYLCHRRKDIWGEDAHEFRPERWEGRKKGFDFIPFSGGPQLCVGQQYSITQVAFVVARSLMRFDRIEKLLGVDNLRKSWQTVLTPSCVKVRLHHCAD